MSILTGLITQQLAVRQGLSDTTKYLLLGWTLGSRPVGLGMTMALINQEADQLPPAPPTTGSTTAKAIAPAPGSSSPGTMPALQAKAEVQGGKSTHK